ncbi:hypothetical protein VTO42DRAFT_7214 [Malbranchea cinnamomea]
MLLSVINSAKSSMFGYMKEVMEKSSTRVLRRDVSQIIFEGSLMNSSALSDAARYQSSLSLTQLFLNFDINSLGLTLVLMLTITLGSIIARATAGVCFRRHVRARDRVRHHLDVHAHVHVDQDRDQRVPRQARPLLRVPGGLKKAAPLTSASEKVVSPPGPGIKFPQRSIIGKDSHRLPVKG